MRLNRGRYSGKMFVLLVCGLLMTSQVDGDNHFKCSRVNNMRRLKGSISSPNYPRSYVRNKCAWIVSAPPGHNVKLTFVAFDLLSCPAKCACDFVEVRDGGTQSSPLITKVCGNYLAMPVIYSTSTQLWIKYRSRDGSLHKGFRAYYQALKVYERLPRIVYVDKNNGTITSPDTPASCGFKRRCTWVIHAPSKPCIKLNFPRFRLRPQKCGREFVEVKDGPNSNSTVIHRFCGSSKPRTIVSTGRSLFIRFRYNTSTDLTVYGFVATFSETVSCNNDATDTPANSQRTLDVMTKIPDRTSIVVGIVCASLFMLLLLIVCIIKIANRDSNAGTTEQKNRLKEPAGKEDYVKLRRHSPSARNASSMSERSDTLITEADPEFDADSNGPFDIILPGTNGSPARYQTN